MRTDLAKLWVIEVIVIVAAVYAHAQQSKAALCAPSKTPMATVQGCFTGSLAHMVFPWLVGGAVLLGVFTLIGTLVHVLRR